MELKINYYTNGIRNFSEVKLKIVGMVDERFYIRFDIPDTIIDEYGGIKYKDILDEDKLKELNIEYFTKYNSEYGITQIVPIGLIDFSTNQITYTDYEITLRSIENKELYTVPLCIDGIVEAIKLKVESAKLRSKCITGKQEVFVIK